MRGVATDTATVSIMGYAASAEQVHGTTRAIGRGRHRDVVADERPVPGTSRPRIRSDHPFIPGQGRVEQRAPARG